MTTTHDLLTVLQQWVDARLDGNWEHHNGIRVSNSDNPGWLVEIISRTDLTSQAESAVVPTASQEVSCVWAGDRIMIHSANLIPSLQFAVTVLSILNGARVNYSDLCEQLRRRRRHG